MSGSKLSDSITSVSNTVDDILKVFDKSLIETEFNNASSFATFLFHFALKVIDLVEQLMKDTSGSIKKYVVVKVLESIVQKYYPDQIEFFNDNIDEIIETIIEESIPDTKPTTVFLGDTDSINFLLPYLIPKK